MFKPMILVAALLLSASCKKSAEAPPVEAETAPEVEVAREPGTAAAPGDAKTAATAAAAVEADETSAAAPAGSRDPDAADPSAPTRAGSGVAVPVPAGGAGEQAEQDGARAAQGLAGDARAGAQKRIAQGASCVGDLPCAAGLECIEYYGIAGPAGPAFASCEIRCKGPGDCPTGQTCTTISDGPGSVCR